MRTHHPHSHFTLLLALLAIWLLLLPGMAGAGVAPVPVPVKTSALNEQTVAANADSVLWAQSGAVSPNHYNVWAQTGAAAPVRLNPPGTRGFAGGIDGTTAVFQQIDTRQSDLVLWDLNENTPSPPPTGVNTARWEWAPSLSGTHYLFGRVGPVLQRVVLFDTSDSSTIVLAQSSSKRHLLSPGQVNGNYATWTNCGPLTCNSYVYDIAGATTTRVPNPLGKPTYSAAVSDDGTIFVVRSGFACGRNVRILKWAIGDPSPTTLVSEPANFDVNDTFEFTDLSSVKSVYYDRVDCRTDTWDVFKIVGV